MRLDDLLYDYIPEPNEVLTEEALESLQTGCEDLSLLLGRQINSSGDEL